MERLRQRLAERLAAVRPPEPGSPYDLRIGPRPETGAARATSASAGTRGSGAARSQSVDWGYGGTRGPAQWGGLCASGQRQSPIDLQGALPVALAPVTFDYRPVPFEVLDTGRALQVRFGPGSAIELQGRRWALQRMTVHHPSEVTLDGRRFELSLHLEHRDDQGRIAMLVLVAGHGPAQPALQQVFAHVPLGAGQALAARAPLDPLTLLPDERSYFLYEGSLTEPPCTEGVLRLVMRHPLSASGDQVELLARLYPMNVRPLQPLAGRRLLQSD